MLDLVCKVVYNMLCLERFNKFYNGIFLEHIEDSRGRISKDQVLKELRQMLSPLAEGTEISKYNQTKNHNEIILLDTISGLVDYYPCLKNVEAVEEFKPKLNIPNTGDNQKDLNLRDQLEKLCKKYESDHYDYD